MKLDFLSFVLSCRTDHFDFSNHFSIQVIKTILCDFKMSTSGQWVAIDRTLRRDDNVF